MKFLQELKAAQETVRDVPLDYFITRVHMTDQEIESLVSILRRIPQLIEVLEWVDRTSQFRNIESRKWSAGYFAKRLLAKLDAIK